MSHSQFHSIKSFILRHAWLNLWDKRMLLAESTRLLSRGHRLNLRSSNKQIRAGHGLATHAPRYFSSAHDCSEIRIPTSEASSRFAPTNSLLPSLSSILECEGGFMHFHQAAISAPPIRIDWTPYINSQVTTIVITRPPIRHQSGMTFALFGDQHTWRSRQMPATLVLSDQTSGSYCLLSSD